MNGETHENSYKQVRGKEAIEFIRALGYKLNVAYTDPDQHPQAGVTNDLMLIDIGRMVMDFLQEADRQVTSYSNVTSSPHKNDFECLYIQTITSKCTILTLPNIIFVYLNVTRLKL